MLATFIGLLSLALCLQGTVLNADFVAAEIQKLDMSAVATEMLSQHSSDALSGTITNLSSDYLSGKNNGTLAGTNLRFGKHRRDAGGFMALAQRNR